MKFRALSFVLLCSAAATPSYAQVEAGPDAAAQEEADATEAAIEDEFEGEEIVITGSRPRGSVIGDISPEITLDARDVRSYGASNIGELLEQLAPQTSSGRGRDGGTPVTLVNGRRISGFSEIRDIPPEAIERVEILPEEVALKYGYRADQRVVNFVLRERFRAITGEIEGGMATSGGRGTVEADFNMLRINDNGRTIIDFEYEREDALLESERDVIQSEATDPFDLIGNLTSASDGAEIDPAFSAIAGQPVTIAAVPGSAAAGVPALSSFIPGANNPNFTDLADVRTLVPTNETFTANSTISRTIFGDVAASLNLEYERTDTQSLQGLASGTLRLPGSNPFSPFAGDTLLFRYFDTLRPLTRDTDGDSGRIGLAMNGDISSWRWNFTGGYNRTRSETRTDVGADVSAAQARIDAGDPTLNPFGPLLGDSVIGFPRERAISLTDTANAEAVFNGSLFDLPAGDATASIRGGVERRGVRSETFRQGLDRSQELSRTRANVFANVDLPIADESREVLGFLGDLSLNLNGELEHFSDFGTLSMLGGGFNWKPFDEVSFIASYTDEDGAPSVQQLGNPVITTPNVRVFDFVRGETVDISRVDGGNPDLLSDNRRVFKLGATVKPFDETDVTLTANYVATRINNPIASFPTATAEIEAAFPDRFVRDASGRLVSIDGRPVNFERSDRKELRWGLNFSKPIGPERQPGAGFQRRQRAGGEAPPGTTPGQEPRPQGQAGAGGQRPGGGAGAGGGFRGPRFGGGGRGQGRLQASIYHTWRFEDEILIRDGVPVLDLLNGSATGSRGGQAEHRVEFQGGIFKDGFGARLSADWQSGTFVRGGRDGSSNDSDLFFSDFTTVDLRVFADLGAQESLVRNHGWLRGARISLNIDNVFDSRLQVRDGTGATPIGYQPNYLDPVGRAVTLSLRKLFF